MDDALVVCAFQRVGDLLGDRQRLVEGDRTFGNAIGQRGPVHELEHERGHACRVFEPVDRSDMRMIERREHLRFTPEPCQAVHVGSNRFRQDLDRDVPPQGVVRRPIHFAHAAGAEQRDDLVRTDAGARSRGHRRRADYSEPALMVRWN
jgi:hypothetical protein